MKINDPNFQPNLNGIPETTPETSTKLGRWSGIPGQPQPSRLASPGNLLTNDPEKALQQLSRRQPIFTPAPPTSETDSVDSAQLETWLKVSPSNVETYVEDHLMDALLESYFKRV